jgi:xanthine phosphoribosyltransferase
LRIARGVSRCFLRVVKPPHFEEITARIAQWPFPAGIDGVVGIAAGGVVPAALVAQRLGVGLKVIAVSYRDAKNEPQFAAPQLVADVPGLGSWKRVLLVDDAYVSGKSWNVAREMLPRKVEVRPFVLSGDVDYALFRSVKACFDWPWTVG